MAFPFPFPYLLLILLLPTLSHSLTCTPNTLYKTCTPLPSLPSTLHYTYTPSNNTLSLSFTSIPPHPTGWVAWGINPTSTGMGGTQALLAFKSPNGTLTVQTYNINISSYSLPSPGKLSFKVFEKKAAFNSKDGSLTIFAKVESHGGKINHVWQVGPGVTDGVPDKHEFNPANLMAKGSLDLSTGVEESGGKSSNGGGGGSESGLKKRNVGFLFLGFVVLGVLFSG